MQIGSHTVELITDGANRISSNFVQFGAVAREQVFQIDPSRGIQTETTERRIRIVGENFMDSANLTCTFGEVESPGTDFISSSEIECVVPFTRLGKKHVRVSNNGVDFAESKMMYEVLPRMSIATISPRHGSFLGGTVVTLTGVFGKHVGIECLFLAKEASMLALLICRVLSALHLPEQ